MAQREINVPLFYSMTSECIRVIEGLSKSSKEKLAGMDRSDLEYWRQSGYVKALDDLTTGIDLYQRLLDAVKGPIEP